MIEYRVAGPADSDAIAFLHTRSWRENYRGAFSDAFLDRDLPGERLGVWRERLNGPPSDQFVELAVDGTELVGFVCAYGAHEPHWGSFVDNLHVAKAAKRKPRSRSAKVPEIGGDFMHHLSHLDFLEHHQTLLDELAENFENRPIELPDGDVMRLTGPAWDRLMYGAADPFLIPPEDGDPTVSGAQDRNAEVASFAISAVGVGMAPSRVARVLLTKAYPISEHCLDQPDPVRAVMRAVGLAISAMEPTEVDRDTEPVELSGSFMSMAKTFRSDRYENLVRTNGDYLDYTGSHYVEIEDDTVKAELWDFLARAKIRKKREEKPEPFHLVRKNVAEVYEPFQMITHVPRTADTHHQRWLRGGDGRPPAEEIVALPNGLLHVPTRRLLPACPAFFTRNLIDIPYDPTARIERWGTFLEELWPDDPEQRDLLQEIMGYLLIPDTSLHKLFFIKGPRRSGKGTILRTVADLVGRTNVSGVSLNRVNQGTAPLEPLLGKLVWLVSDLRLENRAMPGAVECILNVTGEDWMSVRRLYKPAWEGILPVRILMASNKLPRLNDGSAVGCRARRAAGIGRLDEASKVAGPIQRVRMPCGGAGPSRSLHPRGGGRGLESTAREHPGPRRAHPARRLRQPSPLACRACARWTRGAVLGLPASARPRAGKPRI